MKVLSRGECGPPSLSGDAVPDKQHRASLDVLWQHRFSQTCRRVQEGLVSRYSQPCSTDSRVPTQSALLQDLEATFEEGRVHRVSSAHLAKLCLLQTQVALASAGTIKLCKVEMYADRVLHMWHEELGLQPVGDACDAHTYVARSCRSQCHAPKQVFRLQRDMQRSVHIFQLLGLHAQCFQAVACLLRTSAAWWNDIECCKWMYCASTALARAAQTEQHGKDARTWFELAEQLRQQGLQAAEGKIQSAASKSHALHLEILRTEAAMMISSLTSSFLGELERAVVALRRLIESGEWEHGSLEEQGDVPDWRLMQAEAYQLLAEVASSLTLKLDAGGSHSFAAVDSQHYALQALSLLTPLNAASTWLLERYLLLQLRCHLQLAVGYQDLGVPQWAEYYLESGLRTLKKTAPGAHVWTLRFLCQRARLALAGFPCRPLCTSTKDEPPSSKSSALEDLKALWVDARSDGQLIAGFTDAGMSTMEKDLKEEVDSLVVSSIAVHATAATNVCGDDLEACSRGLLERISSTGQQGSGQLLERLLDFALLMRKRKCRSSLWQASIEQVCRAMLCTAPNTPQCSDTLLLRLSEICADLFVERLEQHHRLQFDSATWAAFRRPLEEVRHLLNKGIPRKGRHDLAEKLMLEALEHLSTGNSLNATLEQHLCDAVVFGVVSFQEAMSRGHAGCIRKSASQLVWLGTTAMQKLEGLSDGRQTPTEEDAAVAQVIDVLQCIVEGLVPFCFGTTVMLLHELRHLQPSPHTSMNRFEPRGVCSGTWMQKLPSGTAVAWLHLHKHDRSVLIARCVEDPSASATSRRMFCYRLPLTEETVASLEREMLAIQKENRSSIVEHVGREDCNDDSQRRIYWDTRAQFDQRMASVAASFEKSVLGAWRFLLCTAQPSAMTTAAFLRWFTSIPSLPLLPSSSATMGATCLLYSKAMEMDRDEAATILAALWAPFLVSLGQSIFLELAKSMQEHAHGAPSVTTQDTQVFLFIDPALANFPIESCPCLQDCEVVRAIAPNVALRALERRHERGPFVPASGHCIVDPFGDAAFAGKGLRALLPELEEQSSWTSNTSSSTPAKSEDIMDLLSHRDAFVYMGHGEGAKKLLKQDRLQFGAAQSDGRFGKPCYRQLSSVVLLMGCSSSKISSLGEDFEAFGLPLSILIGGGLATIGVLWDVLGGDLDAVTCSLLRHWLMGEDGKEAEGGTARRAKRQRCSLAADQSSMDEKEALCGTETRAKRQRCSLGKAVVLGRRAASLRNLTGAAVVCYGVPF